MAPPTSALNPRSKASEFLGTPGTAALILVVPSFIYLLYFACSETNGGCPPPLWRLRADTISQMNTLAWWKILWDAKAAIAYLKWYAYCIVAWKVLPGDWVEGTKIRNGETQKYKINAFSTLLLTLGLTAGYIYRYGPQSFTFIYEHWLGLCTASILFSFFQSTLLYVVSFRGDKLLALGGNSDSHIYNFWIGRELNPTFFGLDIKSFCELRPGLILWALINISCACEQATRLGGSITDSMWLIQLFQGWYVFDALYNESAIFTQMDITTDGFGFMLNIGDLAWVPFSYTLQARYLAFHPVQLGAFWTTLTLVAQLTGYYIFRTANGEKNDFRNGKNPKNLKFIETKRGTKLLTSGWWGLTQHPNYFGDIIMGLAWCMTTGLNTPITYFYFFYFVVLLAHRQLRDDGACAKKYGADWEKYKKLVPYKIIPFVY